ncbi:helix-turn-helix domain-containing protein [Halostella sp. PRR32]|uniref:helix-turn-helix domain-containing protein n=1 Tax=Halostella sp. PRR32 TaxID=3098147 RepID=UPI00110F6921|nr:helix-turn-helix domain-containing protein [Halostella sp. PRR32]
MGFISEIHLSPPSTALGSTIRAVSNTPIRWEYTTVVDDSTVLFLSVFGDGFDEFEASLDRDPTVADGRRIATFANRCVYSVRTTADCQLIPPKCSELGIFVFNVVSGDGGWVFRLQIPDRDALLEFKEHCRKHDIGFRIVRLRESDYADGVAAAGLTDQQRELLLRAFYAGYFDVPRRVSQSDLADQLDVSTSAVSQQLRRAIEQLITTTIDADSSGW